MNLTLRALMEAGVVAGLAYWGIHEGSTTAGKVLLGVGAPAVGFGVWGLVDFRGARYAGPLRLVEEMVISALAAVGLYASGQRALAFGLAVVSVVHHVLTYVAGERLLKPEQSVEALDTSS